MCNMTVVAEFMLLYAFTDYGCTTELTGRHSLVCNARTVASGACTIRLLSVGALKAPIWTVQSIVSSGLLSTIAGNL